MGCENQERGTESGPIVTYKLSFPSGGAGRIETFEMQNITKPTHKRNKT
jgi:hypothetical protein